MWFFVSEFARLDPELLSKANLHDGEGVCSSSENRERQLGSMDRDLSLLLTRLTNTNRALHKEEGKGKQMRGCKSSLM